MSHLDALKYLSNLAVERSKYYQRKLQLIKQEEEARRKKEELERAQKEK